MQIASCTALQHYIYLHALTFRSSSYTDCRLLQQQQQQRVIILSNLEKKSSRTVYIVNDEIVLSHSLLRSHCCLRKLVPPPLPVSSSFFAFFFLSAIESCSSIKSPIRLIFEYCVNGDLYSIILAIETFESRDIKFIRTAVSYKYVYEICCDSARDCLPLCSGSRAKRERRRL